jgi:hypothetical protein
VHKGDKGWHFYPEFAEKHFASFGESFLVVDDDPDLFFAYGKPFFERGSREWWTYSLVIGMYQERFYLIASNLESELGPGSYFCD